MSTRGQNFMRLNLAWASLAACLIWLGISPISLHAALRLDFEIDRFSWHATHIVLAQTTANDGVLSVVESWKGDLKPGDSIAVPELKPNENAVPISSYPKPVGSYLRDESGISERIPRQPIGSRVILFLKKQDGNGVETPVKWGPAIGNEMKISVLWIDGGKAFCFQALETWGTATNLSPCLRWTVRSSDAAVFIARIQEVLQAQEGLAETLAFPNVEVRAERLGFIAQSNVYPAEKEAIEALGKAGTVALPEILQVMDKPPASFYDGDALIRVFVEAAGKDSGRQLHARLQQDVIYWRTVGPTLTPDWLDRLTVVGSPLFVKFEETSLLIRELDHEHFAPAAPTVAELHDFWVSQPQLYDPKWGNKQLRTSGGTALDMEHLRLFELTEQCDAFLKARRTN